LEIQSIIALMYFDLSPVNLLFCSSVLLFSANEFTMTTFYQSLPEPSFTKIEELDRTLIFAFSFLFTVFSPCLNLDVESEAINFSL